MSKNTTHTSGSSWNKTTTGGSVTTYTKYKPYKGLKKQVNKAENTYNKLYKNGFNDPYKGALNSTLGRINSAKFEYDLSNDAIYNQLRDQYLAMGATAQQEAQADATALTGGFSNSYAETAGQKAMNSYVTQVQSLIPQLYQQARADYDTNLSNEFSKANLYSGLSANSYAQYADKVTQAAANRDYYYNKYNTMRQLSGKQVQKNNTWQKTKGGQSSTSKSK